MKLPDLAAAGAELAERLHSFAGREDVVVLGLVRGGVPAAIEVARALGAPLDLVVRRTVVPVSATESAVAVNVAGTRVLDEAVRAVLDGPDSPVKWNAVDLLAALDRRVATVRGDRPPTPIEGKTVLLIDNGVRTGDTVRSSIRAIRALAPARLVLGIGAASRESRESLHQLADEVVCLQWPEEIFGHVGLWYRKFDVPADESIGRMFEEVQRVAV